MGGANWLTRDEIPGSIYEERTDASLVLGPLAEDGTILQYSGNGSLVTIAPPNAGKTQCHVLGNLLRYKGPALVLDLKGEAWDKTSKWRAENVGPVWRFAPDDPATSAHYNPFAQIDDRNTWKKCGQLADAVRVPGATGVKDSYFEDKGRNLIAALAYVVATQGLEHNRNMAQVCRLAWGGPEVFNELLRQMGRMDSEEARQSANEMAGTLSNSPGEFSGIINSARRSLEIWRDPDVTAVTRNNSPEWQPMRLRTAPYPTVYLCIAPSDVETYASVLRVIISQHIRALTAKLPDRDQMPILFCLDELPRLGEMAPVKEGIGIGRQYGVRLWLFAQYLGQLRESYEGADGMIGACAVRIYMSPRMEDGTAQKVSDMLGYRESILDGRRYRIAEPTDLTGPEYRDLQIVFGDGVRPAKLLKNFAHNDPSLAGRFGAYGSG